MGIGCCDNKPLGKFVGVWSNGNSARMRIWESETVNYRKEVNGGSLEMTISPDYDENGCSTGLCGWEGICDDQRPNKLLFIVNKKILTKQPIENHGMMTSSIATTFT